MTKRTWFFAVASLIVIVWAAWLILDDGWRLHVSHAVLPIDISTRDEQIREQLLSLTPVGSEGVEVLRFVVDNLSPKSVSSYYGYDRALKNRKNIGIEVMPTHWMKEPRRTIDVEIGSYPGSFPVTNSVDARWVFDEQDRLTDIVISRYGIGP